MSSLLPLGTAGIIAAIVPLNDHAVVPVMQDVHRYLRAGQTLAEAVHRVRRGPTRRPDPAGDGGVPGGARRGMTAVTIQSVLARTAPTGHDEPHG